VKLASLTALAAALVLTWGVSAGAASEQVTFRGWGTAVVDGTLNVNEWDGAGRFPFLVDTSPVGNGKVPATFYVMNDSTNLYFALRVAAPDLGDSDFFAEFLGSPPIPFPEGNDILQVKPTGFEDLFFHPVSPNYWDYQPDLDYGGTRDGQSAVGESGGELVYEFSHPLDSPDDGHDFSVGIPSHMEFFGSFQYCFGYCPAAYIPASSGSRLVIVSGTHVPPTTRFTFGPKDDAELSGYGQFGFVGEDDVAPPSELTYQCKIDDLDWRACESPVSRVATEEGWHRITVRAFDDMLNVDPDPPTRHWRIDTEEPSQPKVAVARRPGAPRMELRISATDRGTPSDRLRFRCKVDAKPFHACARRSRLRFRSGHHVLRFNALDPAGNRSLVKIVRLGVR
jgi:hypothetical protein